MEIFRRGLEMGLHTHTHNGIFMLLNFTYSIAIYFLAAEIISSVLSKASSIVRYMVSHRVTHLCTQLIECKSLILILFLLNFDIMQRIICN